MFWVRLLRWMILSVIIWGSSRVFATIITIPDTIYVTQNSRANVDVLANDVFDGTAVVQSASSGQFSERVVLNSDGTVHYRPLPDFVGEDSFDYTVDVAGETAGGKVVVFVKVFSDMLVTMPDTVFLGVDQAKVIDVLANDVYLGTRRVFVSGLTEQRFDAVSFPLSDGRIYYRAAPDFVGEDRLFYTWSDDLDHTARVGMLVHVDATLKVGVAVDDRAEIVEGTSLRFSVLANDRLIEPVANVEVLDAEHGQTEWDGGNGLAVYIPHDGYVGDDKFAYLITDDQGDQTAALVRVTVLPFNAPPEAIADTVAAYSGRGAVFSVLLNDRDLEGDVLSLISVGASEHGGQVLQNADGSIFYRAAINFVGDDRFTYVIEDASGNRSEGFVVVSVTDDGDAPQALDDLMIVAVGDRVNIDVLANDTFVGDTIAVVDVTQGLYSDLVIANSDQTVHYRVGEGFLGVDHFAYTIRDGQGKMASAVVRLRATGGVAGDFDGDDRVGFGDFLLFVGRFGLRNTDLNFDERMDFNQDGEIGFSDFLQFVGLFSIGAPG